MQHAIPPLQYNLLRTQCILLRWPLESTFAARRQRLHHDQRVAVGVRDDILIGCGQLGKIEGFGGRRSRGLSGWK